jgi:hypothetical protein
LRNPKLFQAEFQALTNYCPTLDMTIQPAGYFVLQDWQLPAEAVLVTGDFPLQLSPDERLAYAIAVVFPDDYPETVPVLFCRDPAIPRIIDRHVMKNGMGCLCIASERQRYFPPQSNIVTFLRNLVEPFLFGQHWYDLTGRWPTEDRSHGPQGIVEAYQEMLGIDNFKTILNFMELLARKTEAKGHLLCPCGNRKNLRDCHGDLIRTLRTTVDSRDAAYDLASILTALNQGKTPNNRRFSTRRTVLASTKMMRFTGVD